MPEYELALIAKRLTKVRGYDWVTLKNEFDYNFLEKL